jgi:hypothetical protein
MGTGQSHQITLREEICTTIELGAKFSRIECIGHTPSTPDTVILFSGTLLLIADPLPPL